MKLNLSKLARCPAPVRIGAFLLILLLFWVPLAGPIVLLVRDPNLASILTLLLLYVEFIVLVRLWGLHVYRQPNVLWRYGLEFSRRSGQEWLTGWTIGAGSLFILFIAESLLGWLTWKPSTSLLQVVLEGLLMSTALAFAEELLFRGWLLDELQRDYVPTVALVVNATIFAAVHGFKVQFPALILLGATLVWAKRIHGERWFGGWRERLALPMGLHAGLVWGYYVVNVGQLIEYTDRVPNWITGVDRNPLAGAIGILFLLGLAVGIRQRTVADR
ncbi:CPBP family intramembrane metalloprotease [Leptolyngbya sp. FACHB-36]|uniref:CPBP family glutamic-type intramembrane protease n=1 Tax=Leptolyngbya sp. FACHB-36 TaxID=2692808 RepID=UPI00168037AF|nr:CPBP family intramembrane metalloprotease [Leptolyngbya sp. FACHB-36]